MATMSAQQWARSPDCHHLCTVLLQQDCNGRHTGPDVNRRITAFLKREHLIAIAKSGICMPHVNISVLDDESIECILGSRIDLADNHVHEHVASMSHCMEKIAIAQRSTVVLFNTVTTIAEAVCHIPSDLSVQALAFSRDDKYLVCAVVPCSLAL